MKIAVARASALLLTLSAIAVAILPARADDAIMVGAIKLETPWTRATPGAAKAGGGFMTITNTGTEPDRLVTGASPRAAKVEFHEMSVNDGIMVMREVDGGIEIPAGATVELKPGGTHVMYMGIESPFKMGETVPTTLTFEKAGTIDVDFSVEKIGAKTPAMGHDGHGMTQDAPETGDGEHKMAK
ncbi:copper chaperone PCu(A)C [Breoghania sp. L-A4]|uniref:copper chaperone PCu(A)C n=1 Tax=Breoghania sp. L-A4 TaxID=2304600 RepID=UPI000E35E32F|nr:copper chaperone PCu(A)C [Breoghania sp. L-A4]AXS39587.1 copper chaperone PCu(A)C [Breoghania sp. L-A4]